MKSHEPILKAIQGRNVLPLSPELLFWTKGKAIPQPSCVPMSLVQALMDNPRQDIQNLLATPKSIKLDKSQTSSLLLGLTQAVSLIQGPPGRLSLRTFHDGNIRRYV